MTFFKNRLTNFLALSLILFYQNISTAQIWDAKTIEFDAPVQGYNIRAINDKVAVTYGSTIVDDGSGGWDFSNEEKHVYITNNGGNTWEASQFKFSQDEGGFICDVLVQSKDAIYVSYYDLALGPVLYYTLDGGNIWQSNNAGVNLFLNWVHFFDDSRGLAFGDPGDDGNFEIAMTENGGVTWDLTPSNITAIETDEYGVLGSFAAKGDDFWAPTNYGRVLSSSDKGQTWQVNDGPNVDFRVAAFSVDDNKSIFMAFDNEADNTFQIFSKKANANDWTEVVLPNKQGTLLGFTAIPGTSSLILNMIEMPDDSSTYKTIVSTDAGTNWRVVESGRGNRCGTVDFISPSIGYSSESANTFINSSNTVFKYNGSPLTGILSQNKLENIDVSIFPNPSSDFVNIKVASESMFNYWIILNDATGKLVDKKIFNRANSINTTFNISSLPIGQYHFTVANEKGVYTKTVMKK